MKLNFKQFKQDMKEELFYIQNEGYCGNALFWWGEEDNGYTTDIRKAGKYTREAAKYRCKRPEDHAWPVAYIDGLLEAQKLIIDSQYIDHKNEIKFI